MIDLSELRYKIGVNDLYLRNFPYNKVLQQKYNSNIDCCIEFKEKVRKYLRNLIGRRDIERINIEIYEIVNELRIKYPECFDDIGWYSKNMLAYLYITGRLSIDGYKLYPAELEAYELIKLKDLQDKENEEIRLKEVERQKYLLCKTEYESNRELSRRNIKVGDIFKNKFELIEAFNLIIPISSKKYTHWSIVCEYVVTKYTSKGWEIIEILKNGGSVYTKPKWNDSFVRSKKYDN